MGYVSHLPTTAYMKRPNPATIAAAKTPEGFWEIAAPVWVGSEVPVVAALSLVAVAIPVALDVVLDGVSASLGSMVPHLYLSLQVCCFSASEALFAMHWAKVSLQTNSGRVLLYLETSGVVPSSHSQVKVNLVCATDFILAGCLNWPGYLMKEKGLDDPYRVAVVLVGVSTTEQRAAVLLSNTPGDCFEMLVQVDRSAKPIA